MLILTNDETKKTDFHMKIGFLLKIKLCLQSQQTSSLFVIR
jgi:hypothetical protein